MKRKVKDNEAMIVTKDEDGIWISSGKSEKSFSDMTKRERNLHSLALVLKTEMQRESAKRFDGYRYFRITVEDVDGGDLVSQKFYTYRKPSDFPALVAEIARATHYPDEILKSLPIDASFQSAEEHNAGVDPKFIVKDKTYEQVIKKQLGGGRKEEPEWRKLVSEWKQGGYAPKVKRQLWEKSGKKYGWETFDRTLKRYKKNDKG